MVDLPDFKKTFPKFIANPPKFDRLSEKGQDFMYKLLKPNPNARMTCHEALNHPYLEKCTVTDDKY
jgi:serine/threonine protein kinase